MGDGQVVPFERRRRGDPQAPPDRRARPATVPGEAYLTSRVRRAAPEARRLAVEQGAGDRQAYGEAAAKQRADALIAAGKVIPARISWALDVRELDGPKVDIDVGTYEGAPLDEGGDVDDWEDGRSVPTAEQVRALAKLTDFPEAWFYEPVKPGPTFSAGVMCFGGRRGCEPLVSDVITGEGVLLIEGKPRPPKRAVVQGELFLEEPGSSRPRQRAQEPAPATRAAPRRERPGPARRAGAKPAAGEQLVLPPGRLADDERAALLARIEQARAKHH